MPSKHHDTRPVWQKLLDPIRGMYADEPGDEAILHHLVHDFQHDHMEVAKLSHICQRQANMLRKAGLGGY